MTTAVLAPDLYSQFWNQTATAPAIGYKLFSYIAGTSTKQPTYLSSTISVGNQNANPTILASDGSASIWLDPTLTYKFVLAPANDTDPPLSPLWSRDNVTSSGTTSLTQAQLGAILYPQTPAESAAGVVPSNLGYPPCDVRRYGAIADGLTDNAIPFAQANLVMTRLGGGTLSFPDVGIYNTSATILMAGKTKWQGAGMQATIIQYTGAVLLVNFTTTGGTNEISDMHLRGTGNTGEGVRFGDAVGFAGLCTLNRVYIDLFNIGVRLGGALWGTIRDCRIEYNVTGIDFNATWALGHSNAIAIERCSIAFNQHSGIDASNVPARNQNVAVRGGSIEQNCSADLTRYQYVCGAVEQLTIDNVYLEYAAAGTKPNGIFLTSAADFSIRECFFNSLNIGIFGTATTRGYIGGCRFIGTILSDITLSGGGNVHDIEISNTNELSGVGLTLAGVNVTQYTASRAQQLATAVAFTPTIKGSTTAGAPTYSVQTGFYSQVGNMVFFQLRVSITAIGGMAGNVLLATLPKPNGSGTALYVTECSGVTPTAGYTLYASLFTAQQTLNLSQTNGVTNGPVNVTQLAAGTTIIISGSYQTASNS